MGSLSRKKDVLLLILLISASSFFSISPAAGRIHKFVNYPATKRIGTATEEMEGGDLEEVEVHQRMLKVRTNDYGSYDPTPAFVKPPFKLIPN